MFLADDSLGWVYQFWQTKKKDEVNKCGDKIGGRTLPAVTQLFTEDYMVLFLLDNTLGAWWGPAGNRRERRAVRGACGQGPSGDGIPALDGRRDSGGRRLRWLAEVARRVHAARPLLRQRAFPGRRLRVLCRCGCRRRAVSEDACDAVLRENLFGLELDPRCTQIAAFALALAAWKYRRMDIRWAIAPCRR